jgi:hypothetical protein
VEPTTEQKEAAAIVKTVGKIKEALATHGFGSVSLMMILGEMMQLTTVVNKFNTLPSSERDEFFLAVWDEAIGNEEHALVGQVGMFKGDSLEMMSDGLKGAALAYFNKKVALPA